MSQPKKTLKMGVIGLGWPGRMHSQAIEACADTELYAIADLSAERREEFAGHGFKPSQIYTEYQAMLADPKVDAVIVSLPNFLHAIVSKEALLAGKHVLCEKPPTMNAGEMEELEALAVKQGLVYAFGRQLRFSGPMQASRKLVEEGRLGDIYYARTTWIRNRGIPIGIGGWFTDAKRSGGGAIIDLGIHTLDNVWYIMGAPRPVSVNAQVFQKFSRLVPKEIHNDVDDCGFAFIRFENDAVISLETTWASNLGPSFVPHQNGAIDNIIMGTTGALVTNPLRLCNGEGKEVTEEVVNVEKLDEFGGQMADFAKAILTGGQPTSNARQAVDLMKMLDAIYKSSAENREIRM